MSNKNDLVVYDLRDYSKAGVIQRKGCDIVFSVNLVNKKELNLMLKVSVSSSQGAEGLS